MAATHKERGPCDNCRDRHVKCSRGAPCDSCVKHDSRCTRERAFRFKKGPRFKSSLSFSADQPWLGANTDQLSYVDMTKNVTRKHGSGIRSRPSKDAHIPSPVYSTRPQLHDTLSDVENETEAVTTQSIDDFAIARRASSFPPPDRQTIFNDGFEPQRPLSSSNQRVEDSLFTIISSSTSQWRPTNQLQSVLSPRADYDTARDQWRTSPGDFPSPLVMHQSSHTSPVAASTNRSNQSSALSGVPETTTDNSYLGLKEACLMRHFVEQLAPWFDTCDRDRHYTVVVPQRAMFCPVLLYAVYTASARHLTRLPSRRNAQNVVEYNGIPLHDLNEETAIHYHNISINHLIEISNDPAQSYNEDALTAATILRFYEYIDVPLTGCDSEIYLNVIRTVIDSQKDPSFYAIWKIQGPPRDPDLYDSPACSLRHFACMVALQQEISSILLTQRPCRLPLCPNNNYSAASLPPTDDFVWTSRILVWTADVLKFCFGDENSNTINMSVKTRIEHWEALKKFEESWAVLMPPSFKPTYYIPADRARRKVFPDIWHMTDCQTVALQHVELAKILLAVHSPKLPRLGLGAEAAQRTIRVQTRESCLRICGLGFSRRGCPAAMVNAAIGISICGECFRDKDEQEAVVKLMEVLQVEHAWPTQAFVDALREAWNGALIG